MNTFHYLLIGFWILYVAIHSIMAGKWFKARVERLTGTHFKYYRVFYSIVAAVSLMALLIFQFTNASSQLFTPGIIHYALAFPLTVVGLVVMMICIRKYFLNLSGVDVFMKKKRTAVLEKGGLHAYVRHPLYAGTLLFIWALFLVFPLLSNLIACVIITVYTLIGIRIEEEKLVNEFVDVYRQYAETVPMLIPDFKF